MTVLLGIDTLRGTISMREAIDLLEKAFAREAAGATTVSPKFVTEFNKGAIRILFAADEQAGYAAMKAYHSVKGLSGARYVVSLYSLKDGEVLAFIDAQLITDLRTGACSGVIARKVPISGPVSLGVIGSGSQARTQLECLASVYQLGEVAVYSPTPDHREHYAKDMSRALGIKVTPVASAEAAVRGKQVVASASGARSADPVVRGEWLADCRLLCAVGNTRKQFVEADGECFRRSRLTVVDTRHALDEAGELVQAVKAGLLPQEKVATLGDIVTGTATLPRDGLIVFKSVGSALQDLTLAARYYELLGDKPGLPRGDGVGQRRQKAWAAGAH